MGAVVLNPFNDVGGFVPTFVTRGLTHLVSIPYVLIAPCRPLTLDDSHDDWSSHARTLTKCKPVCITSYGPIYLLWENPTRASWNASVYEVGSKSHPVVRPRWQEIPAVSELSVLQALIKISATISNTGH